MDSFEDLGIAGPLIETLAAEGMEDPTSLQAKAIPVLTRGHDLVLRAGPGSGITLAYGLPILARNPEEAPGLAALIVVQDETRARGVAESLGRIAMGADHHVAALAPGWFDPTSAGVLVAPPGAAAQLLESGDLDLGGVRTLVLEGLGGILAAGLGAELEAISGAVPEDAQRVVTSLPLTEEGEAFVDRHLRRATHVPPPVRGEDDATRRGTLEFALVSDDRLSAAADRIGDLLTGGASHVLAFCRTEDNAADLGDLLALHGFPVGMPGDADSLVWLGVQDMEGRAILREWPEPDQVATLSLDAPADPDSLDRRHGVGGTAMVLVFPREMPHLRDVAREAGYSLRSPLASLPAGQAGSTAAPALPPELFERIRSGTREQDPRTLAHLLGRFAVEDVASAAVDLLISRGLGEIVLEEEEAGLPRDVPSWVKLFLTVGSRDGLSAGDLLGAMTGEAGIAGSDVGRIEIRENYSRVEVKQDLAPQVVKAVNGITIRGRSVRADYDRGGKAPGGGPDDRPNRGGNREGRGGGGGRPGKPRRRMK